MEQIRISTGTGYTVYIGENLLENAGAFTALCGSFQKLMILSDENVFPLYSSRLIASLKKSGYRCFSHIIPPGEGSKTPENLFKLWNALAENGFLRSDAIISLGGGVVSDLGGFAASTYMRGISHIIFSTTLLSMADASVGGKTAVNLKAGKNLAGAFYAPSAVFCDISALNTLSASLLADGMAEIIKCGMIRSKELLFSLLGSPSTEEMISAAVKIKKEYVELDEKDNGERKKLNFGHTLAHAAETLSNGSLSHGKAVAAGMYITTKAAVKNGLCAPDALEILEKLLFGYSLEKALPFPLEALCKAAVNDKKRSGDTLTLVIPEAPGKASLKNIPADKLYDFFN